MDKHDSNHETNIANNMVSNITIQTFCFNKKAWNNKIVTACKTSNKYDNNWKIQSIDEQSFPVIGFWLNKNKRIFLLKTVFKSPTVLTSPSISQNKSISSLYDLRGTIMWVDLIIYIKNKILCYLSK